MLPKHRHFLAVCATGVLLRDWTRQTGLYSLCASALVPMTLSLITGNTPQDLPVNQILWFAQILLQQEYTVQASNHLMLPKELVLMLKMGDVFIQKGKKRERLYKFNKLLIWFASTTGWTASSYSFGLTTQWKGNIIYPSFWTRVGNLASRPADLKPICRIHIFGLSLCVSWVGANTWFIWEFRPVRPTGLGSVLLLSLLPFETLWKMGTGLETAVLLKKGDYFIWTMARTQRPCQTVSSHRWLHENHKTEL